MFQDDVYPRSVFLIIATEFCERFSFCGLRTILSLYLRDVLLFHENTATITYHVFIMLSYFVPVVGAIFADSFLGRYRTIYYFGVVYTLGNILMCLAATPPVSLPPVPFTILGLIIIAIGTGGIKPCVAAFGGDQFRLPQQEDKLHQFFSIFYFTINFGGLVGMVATPILRNALTCFGDDTCYALGFGFPAALMVAALILFLAGKPLYRMKSPKVNIIYQFIKCSTFAFIQRFKSKEEPKEHWLDYADDTYDRKLIADMKIVLAMLYLLIPLPLFWSLFDQQGSRWTFQASRMNGELLGMQLRPDQMQVLNPAVVLMLIPLFDNLLYPLTDRIDLLTSLLKKMVIGGVFAGIAFIVSGVLELKLEETYPLLPEKHQAHLNFINTLPCDVQILNPFNHRQVVNATKKYVFQNVAAHNVTGYDVSIFTPYQCGNISVDNPRLDVHVVALEKQVKTVVISLAGSTLQAYTTDPDQLNKSLSGKPKVRMVFVRGPKMFSRVKVKMETEHGFKNIYYVPEIVMRFFKQQQQNNKECFTKRTEKLESNNQGARKLREPYNMHKYSVSFGDLPISDEQEVTVELGGVYTLVVQENEGDITFSKLYVMTPPNTIHMLWLVPQYVFISVAEVMFAISGLKFYCTQAPNSMKTVSTAAWYVSVAFGNILVIIITQMRLFKSQANEFFMFAGLILVDMLIFMVMIRSYTFVNMEADGSSCVSLRELTPLIEVQNDSETPSSQSNEK
ncbi:peptide transporter family 1-like [Anabrus simplex]|uniref:peptide transporter family 1-like n=1 Tax=Anabrus simplex TaxID=316456 RepID=UPI0035A2DF10